jgi:hypothetical protein
VADGWAASLFGKLRALELPAQHYAVFGSGPLAVRGLIEHISDLDVVARGPAWRKAAALGPVGVASGGDQVVRLEGGTIEIFDGWLGWDTDAIIDGAETIEGLPFARLEEVQAFKLHHGRPKDLEHAQLIGEHLRCDLS